jgi:hypothetical protein
MKKEIKGNSAGKGSARRQENFGRIQKNWSMIKWGNQWCAFCGIWGNHTSGTCKKISR